MRFTVLGPFIALGFSGAAAAYCPVAGNTGYEYIAQTNIDGVVTASGNDGGYADYSQPAIALAERNFEVILTPGFPSGAYSESWAVWIDHDFSGTYEVGERVFTGSGSGPVNGSIGVPPGAPAGETGMRVMMAYGSSPTDPCASVNWGEVEDYAVVIPEADGGGTPGEAETPWQSAGVGTVRTGIAWNYAMGYHFSPQVDGQVTAVGGLFSGAKTVRLFDRTTGEVLAVTTVAAANDWSYGDLATPVDVVAGEEYTVAVYLAGSGGAYQTSLGGALPGVFGNVRIDGTTYAYTGSLPDARPTNVNPSYMFGIADIRFVAATDPGGDIVTDCEIDDLGGLAVSGEMTTGPIGDIVPVCNGVVLIGDQSDSSVKAIDAGTGTEIASYALPAVPGDMDLDRANGWLYVALDAAPGVARIDLATGDVTSIDVGFETRAVAAAPAGQAFAILQGAGGWPDRPIAILDGGTDTHVSTYSPSSSARGALLLAFDADNGKLMTGDVGFSPSSLVRYGWDGLNLVEEEYLWNAGGNGEDLSVSGDGAHLGYAVGGGNGSGYTIFDFDPLDLTSSAGEWDTGPYPRTVHFSPDSVTVATSNGYGVEVFDVGTHLSEHLHTPPLAGCTYSQIERVRYSLGGGVVFGFSNCGFDDDSARLFWTTP